MRPGVQGLGKNPALRAYTGIPVRSGVSAGRGASAAQVLSFVGARRSPSAMR
jgi:hypothetical protein